MSQFMIQRTIWPVRPAKTQISLYIHPVWQGFSFIPHLSIFGSTEAVEFTVESTCDQQRLWSDCANAQSDLSLCWSHKSYCWFCCMLASIISVIKLTEIQVETPLVILHIGTPILTILMPQREHMSGKKSRPLSDTIFCVVWVWSIHCLLRHVCPNF